MHLNLILLLGEKRQELVLSPSLRNESGADPRLTALEEVGVGDGVGLGRVGCCFALGRQILLGLHSLLFRTLFFTTRLAELVCVFFS